MHKLLNEKYRPTSPDGYIFKDKKLKGKVEEWITNGEIPNLLLSGPPGTGKSSLARMLISSLNVDESDVMIVNSALNSKIELVRDVIEPWVKRRGFSKFKIILLEEFERVSPDAQKALKAITEDYSETVRYIATSNRISKLDDALLSRFQHFVLDSLDIDDIIDFVVNIIEKENITLEGDDENALMSHIEKYQPDMRKIVNSIDQHCVDGVLSRCDGSDGSTGIDVWDRLWVSGDAGKSPSELIELTDSIDSSNYESFFEIMYHNIEKNVKDVPSAVILISTYLDRATRVANHRILMDACIYQMFFIEE